MFIAFEGVDGAGKTTLAKRLASYVEQELHQDVVLVREPGGTVEAEKIRDLIVSNPTAYFDPVANALLFGAARAQVTNTLIRPALQAGKVVISDRYKASSIAYQHFGSGTDLNTVIQMNELSSGGLNPDLTFLFHVGQSDSDLAEVLGRNGKKDARDTEEFDFYRRVDDGYYIIHQKPDYFRLPSTYIGLNPLDRLADSFEIIVIAVQSLLKWLK